MFISSEVPKRKFIFFPSKNNEVSTAAARVKADEDKEKEEKEEEVNISASVCCVLIMPDTQLTFNKKEF
jgi:hypothetical protein